MNREEHTMHIVEQEMSLWCNVCSMAICHEMLPNISCIERADFAVAEFRKRYNPVTQPIVYDEPPFPKDKNTRWCWVKGYGAPKVVYWSSSENAWRFHAGGESQLLAGRRVSPIDEPKEL